MNYGVVLEWPSKFMKHKCRVTPVDARMTRHREERRETIERPQVM